MISFYPQTIKKYDKCYSSVFCYGFYAVAQDTKKNVKKPLLICLHAILLLLPMEQLM